MEEFYREVLYEEEDIPECLEIAEKCVERCEFTTISGKLSSYYWDIDKGLSDPEVRKKIEKIVLKFLRKLELDKKVKFDRIGFIEHHGAGPAGVLTMKDLIASKINKPTVIVRPKKRLLKYAVKVDTQIREGENILLFSDVATEGYRISEAANILWRFGAKVLWALVVFDRDEGANENLAGIDIRLRPILDSHLLVKYNKPLERGDIGKKVRMRLSGFATVGE